MIMPYLNSKLSANMHFGFPAAEGTVLKDALQRERANGKDY